jgi:hypothetical protein
MKRIKILSLFAVSILMAAASFAQSADEIISKHIEAIGGAENWKKIKNIKQEASINLGAIEIPVVITAIHNVAVKQEATFNGMTQFSIIRKDSGWALNPMMGQTKPEPLTTDDLKNGGDQLDIQGEFIDYKLKGHSIELLTDEDIDGSDCNVIRITRKTGTESLCYFDKKTYYMIRSKSKILANGQEIEVITNMSNFQKLNEGIIMPYTIETPSAPAPINLKQVIINGKIDESIFKILQ